MSGPQLRLVPADVRRGDRVLVHGSWWIVASAQPALFGDEWHLLVEASGDEMTLRRQSDDLLDVDRPGNRWPWEADQ